MKKNLLITTMIVTSIAGKSFGQKLEENKTDDHIKRTSWETLYSAAPVNTHFRFSKINDTETFDLKMMRGDVFSIEKDMEVIFTLDNGDLVKLKNLEYAITCKGCGAVGFNGSGAEGIQTAYPVSKDDLEKLKAHKAVKVRIYAYDGYIDNDIKDQNAAKIMAALNLL